MAETPKNRSKTDNDCSDDQANRSYYYDDAHGYEVYEPDAEPVEPRFKPIHRWNVSEDEAVELQKKLGSRVIVTDDLSLPVKTVAGIDLGHDPIADISTAVIAVLSYPELRLVESREASMPIQFPYIPGLLSFRDIPVVIDAMNLLEKIPDLILYNGVGLAHPRRFGVASHVGVATGIPTIGVSKSLLVGRVGDLGEKRGSTAPITHRGKVIGTALRTRDDVAPVYVSVGHRIGLETAVGYVLNCTGNYRLPETTRVADRLAATRKTANPDQPSLFG